MNVTELVIEDIKSRAEIGLKKYGTYLNTFNGRSALQDAYEECLDKAQYLKQAILEEEERKSRLNGILKSIQYELDNYLLTPEVKQHKLGIITGILESM